MDNILVNVLKNIKPSAKEASFVSNETKKFIQMINKKLRDAKAEVGGSFEKKTWISGNYDVDIFVRFNYERYKDQDISKELEKVLLGIKKTKLHGSRDYFQIKHGKFNIEIVPVLEIKNYKEALNVTDVSPLHSKFIKQNTNKRLQEEIMVTKQFFKANNLYGAESYIKGFSGYVVELLIIHYKSFDNLIKIAAKWPDNVVIDIKKHYKNTDDVIFNLNWSKKGPLILIDPTQKNRNVAAAVSKEKIDELRTIAKAYLKKPSEDFFIKKEFNINKLEGYSILEIVPKSGKKDIIGSRLLKMLESIQLKLTDYGFEILDYGWEYNKKTYFWFKSKNQTIDNTKKHYGPFMNDKENLKKFKDKWQGYKIYEENKKSYIFLERKFNNINSFLSSLIKDKLIKDQVKTIRLL